MAEQTFHMAKRRIGYIEAIREAVDAEIEIYMMMPDDAQWEINLRARNDKRSVETAKRQAEEDIEFPNPAEGFDRIYEVTGDRITLRMDTPAPEIIDKAKAELEEERKKQIEEAKKRMFGLVPSKTMREFFSEFDELTDYLFNRTHCKSYTICKYLVFRDKNDLRVKNPLKFSPYSRVRQRVSEYMNYDGYPVSGMDLSGTLQIMRFRSSEVPVENTEIFDSDTRRFENAFLYFPFEGEYGTPVKLLTESDDEDFTNYGVLIYYKQDREENFEKSKEKQPGYEFHHSVVTVYFLTKEGYRSPRQINPVYPEFGECPPESEDEKAKAYADALDAFSDVWKGYRSRNGGIDAEKERKAISLARKYRDIWREESEKQVISCDTARNVRDIMIMI